MTLAVAWHRLYPSLCEWLPTDEWKDRRLEMLKRLITAAVTFTFAIGLTGCNTIRGAGMDIERAGEKIQDHAEKTKEKM
jgi:predicted small secreted protein